MIDLDSESLFCILIYLCVCLKEPQNRIRVRNDLSLFKSFPIAEWFTAESSSFVSSQPLRVLSCLSLHPTFEDVN